MSPSMPPIWPGDHGGAGMPAQILSVASGKLRMGGPLGRFRGRPVNNGWKLWGGRPPTIFSLGNPLGLTDTWARSQARHTPVIPSFPPYLVFDSESRTIA